MTSSYYGEGGQPKVMDGKLDSYFARIIREKMTEGSKTNPKLDDFICERSLRVPR